MTFRLSGDFGNSPDYGDYRLSQRLSTLRLWSATLWRLSTINFPAADLLPGRRRFSFLALVDLVGLLCCRRCAETQQKPYIINIQENT